MAQFEQGDALKAEAIVETLPLPAIILSDSFHVIYSNNLAKTFLAEQSDLLIDNNSLVLHSSEDIVSLEATIALKQSKEILIKRKDGGPAWVCHVSPLSQSHEDGELSLLEVLNYVQNKIPSEKMIMEFYNISSAEAKLCVHLLEGLSLKCIANKTNKSELTLRTYLKQIYQKTGFKRQGELISNILITFLR
ncbi:helix-turn-helix transcriptional regulator [Marinomonas dokdonensis]|uniref:helix-turn-helix transcriptional regulator n=1 Tax=Marinomonas dokdonensis TaxID=328224 RepID=UPI0040555D44